MGTLLTTKKDKSRYFKESVLWLIGIAIIISGIHYFFTKSEPPQRIDNLTTQERIQPLGKLYIEGDIDIPTPVVDTEKSTPVIKKSRSGESIYTSSCAGCHGIGVAGAPKTNNIDDWAPKLKRGMDDLVKVAISGKGAMPPKGACMDCSDDELRSAIEFMTK